VEVGIMTTEDFEYSLSQYADGTLPEGERAAVEARLAVDPAAHATVVGYRRLDALLREPPLALDWDRLAERLSAGLGVDAAPTVVGRIGEDPDYALSQYADGTLPEGERVAVEAQLAAAPDARATVAGYRRLDALLREPPPDLDWDRLAERFSAGLGADDAPVVVGRIGFAVRRWTWTLGSLAAAAVVAVTVARMAHRSGTPTPTARITGPVSHIAGPEVAVVSGPAVEAGSGAALSQVSIGPSPALARASSAGRRPW
jgi:anti-sigma factor RsiW